MEKKYIIGGLAIVGAIALIAYLKPKAKVNSEGFYGASGGTKGISSSSKQLQCRRPNGTYYLMPSGYSDCTYSSDKEVRYV
jgi:hypothetical protein